ncbi:ribosomal-processing cysteine protease Prp [Haloimpatiens lingqiaonensis]|uniref:ribosomal-processing cysteine protease Prp n=1 Tax=Haloimpatiens lingqiaonensis TaxID=1380675 RepID=UPI0010FDF930|nr:ribosomal-processing cysteine protease Prp [Haloimpatiens lingqiaonensis]
MISVKAKRKKEKLVCISLEGHSDYSEEGSDIVCSAATAISCSVGDGILTVLNIQADCSAEEGYININIEDNSPEEIDRCQVLMETLLLGLKNIQSNYGGYIKVHEEEV